MFWKLVITAFAIAIAAPASANGQLAKSLGVPEGKYTAIELAQIAGETTASDRAARIVVIDKSRAAFADAVRNVVIGTKGQ